MPPCDVSKSARERLGLTMDDSLRIQLEKLIDKFNVRMKEDGSGLTWDGLPDKRTLGHLKMNPDSIIEILNERK